MLPVRQEDAADSNHIHVADSFPDDGESVVADFSIWDQIIRTDEIANLVGEIRIDHRLSRLFDMLDEITQPHQFEQGYSDAFPAKNAAAVGDTPA